MKEREDISVKRSILFNMSEKERIERDREINWKMIEPIGAEAKLNESSPQWHFGSHILRIKRGHMRQSKKSNMKITSE